MIHHKITYLHGVKQITKGSARKPNKSEKPSLTVNLLEFKSFVNSSYVSLSDLLLYQVQMSKIIFNISVTSKFDCGFLLSSDKHWDLCLYLLFLR